MNETQLQEKLAASGVSGVGALDSAGKDPFVRVEAEAIVDALTFLRDDDECGMEMLHNVTAVERDDAMEVTYHLCSLSRHHSLTLKVSLPRPEGGGHDDWIPEVPSVASVYNSASWHEREQWDLLGVRFTGHPDHRRILLPEEWIGHPLRRDYVYPTALGEVPLELDAVPMYERQEGEPVSKGEPRPAGAPLDQGKSERSTRPHAGGKAPPPGAKPAKAAPKPKDDEDGGAAAGKGGDGGGDGDGGKGGDDMAARIAAIKAKMKKGDG